MSYTVSQVVGVPDDLPVLVTAGTWATEAESAAAFDSRVEPTGLFWIRKEVQGCLIQPRPGQVDKGMRIDRILVPTEKLLGLGWVHGAIGVEVKQSGIKVGPALAQMADYARTAWMLVPSRLVVMLSFVFLWPTEKTMGTVASILAQQRLGTASFSPWSTFKLAAGECNILEVSHSGRIHIGQGNCGLRAGSR